MPNFLTALTLTCVLLGHPAAPKPVAAHPVSVVQADVYVGKARTTMKLTCFAEDLELLQGVEALESGFYDSQELRDALKDHADYLAEKIEILDVSGEPIEAKVTQIIDFEIPEDGIKSGQLMQYVMGFVMEYEHKTPPEFLTLRQNMIADGALLPSELKILLKQSGSDTPYTHMMKPGIPETFRFDWESPLLAPDAAPDDWESWFAEQREKTLGIDSYSSTYSFIYINNHEVRHEVLIPLATLAALIEFERADNSFLDVSEQEVAGKKIEAWFSSGNPVLVNGAQVEPKFDRIDFYGLDLRDFAIRAKARKVSMASGRVGVIMSYPAKQPPESVEVTWDMFNHAIRSVDSVIFAYDETLTTAFSKFLANNTFRWQAETKRQLPELTPVTANVDDWSPVAKFRTSGFSIALVCIAFGIWFCKPFCSISLLRLLAASGVALATATACHWSTSENNQVSIPIPFAAPKEFQIPPDQAEPIFEKLHKNLFTAFDFREASDVYDALAHTVDGPLLRELYLDVQQSLKMREQGGAVAKIESIEVLQSKPSTELALNNQFNQSDSRAGSISDSIQVRPTFGWRCEWNLSGTVEHWGHIHERINQYDARFNVSAVDGNWKITRLQMTDNQGTVKTSLRKLETK
jgi:hypothetical protein